MKFMLFIVVREETGVGFSLPWESPLWSFITSLTWFRMSSSSWSLELSFTDHQVLGAHSVLRESCKPGLQVDTVPDCFRVSLVVTLFSGLGIKISTLLWSDAPAPAMEPLNTAEVISTKCIGSQDTAKSYHLLVIFTSWSTHNFNRCVISVYLFTVSLFRDRALLCSPVN